MKIRSSSKAVGFYESFSDLIFATMAVFVLLMVIFLVLAHESNPVRQAKRKLESVEQSITETRQQTAVARDEAKSLAESVEKLAEKEVEIAIVVDKTGSMEQELYNLKHAIGRLGNLLPLVMNKVSMSVVAYRIDENGSDSTAIFPMQQIRKAEDDGGQSTRKLDAFLSAQRHQSGTAPILQATRSAIGQFSDTNDFRGHQVLMVLGDVGPYEINYSDTDTLTPEGQRRAEELVRVVSGWAKSRKHRNLILMFSGRDEINYRGYGATNARRQKHIRSMELFQQIAQASGQEAAYTENQASMFVDFLVAALKRR